MLTQCPGCKTVFRVTGAILRAAHGQVRCGKCAQQFDAIAHLLDNEDVEPAEPQTAASESPTEDSGLGGIGHEDIILEGHRIEITGVYDRLSPEDGKNHLEHNTIIEEFNIGSEQWENPFVEPSESPPAEDVPATEPGAVFEQDEELVTEVEDVEAELNAVSLVGDIASLDPDLDLDSMSGEHITIEAPPESTPGESTTDTESSPTTRQSISSPKPAADESPSLELSADDALAELAPARCWPWALAVVGLLALLSGQTLHHWRANLARHPGLGPVLIRVYQALGQTLTPEWQLTAYHVKQWGVVSDPAQPGTLRVRASVTNEASFAQPYPVLRLTLEDRFGAQVGRRDFKPQEYLNAPPPPERLLDANAAANIDLAIVDPGSDAVGFQFDSCLPAAKTLVCAHDQP